MFQGNFSVVKTEDGYIEGVFTGDTPAGPFTMELSVPIPHDEGGVIDELKSKGLAFEIMGECLGTADYFPIPSLIGKGAGVFAKKLFKRLHSKRRSTREKARRQFKIIQAKAKAGHGRSMDVAYAINRIKKELDTAKKYKTEGGQPLLTEDLLLGFDYRRPVKLLKMASRRSPFVLRGIRTFKRLSRLETKGEARRDYSRLRRAAKFDPRAKAIVQTVKLLSRAELERRRQLKQPLANEADEVDVIEVGRRKGRRRGGFNFDKFMRKVGKIAGPFVKAIAPLASKIPMVGDALVPALKTLGDTMSESQPVREKAQRKIRRVGVLAKAGIPKAIRAREALKVGIKLRRAAILTKAVREGAIRPSPAKRVRRGPVVAQVLATDPQLVSAYYAGSYAGLRESKRVFGK